MKIGRLDVEVTGSRAVLAGRIDDTVQLEELVRVLPATGTLTFDTGAVTFVNSLGMREWIRLIRAVRERGQTITLERVADVMMSQLNMIDELATSVRITSFFAPYECPACGAEPRMLIDAIEHASALRMLAPPRLPCPECGAAMELDDFPERYLAVFRG